jgi:hypothetical protein
VEGVVEARHMHGVRGAQQRAVEIEERENIVIGRQAPQSLHWREPNYHRLSVTLRHLHESWAWFVVIGNGLAGLWALAAHRFESLRSRALWWFVGAAEVAIFIQVILGVAMVSSQHIQPPKFHMFYGFVAILTVGIIYSYRAQLAQYRYLLYGLGSLFLMGLAIRAMIVGTGAR